MCDCVEKMNELLKEKNGKIAQGFQYSKGGLTLLPTFVSTEKIESRKKAPPTVVANYCPFCGEKYPEASHD
jgi:hypothetical protein